MRYRNADGSRGGSVVIRELLVVPGLDVKAMPGIATGSSGARKRLP